MPVTRTRQVLHLMLGTGAMQAGSMAIFIILARFLPQADFGTWRQLFIVQQVAQAFIFSALPMSLLRFSGCADAMGARAVIRQHLWLTVALGAIALLVILAAADGVAALLGNEGLAPLLRLFAPQIAAVMLTALVAPALVSMSRTWLSASFSLLVAIITSLPLLLAALHGAGLHALVLVSVSAWTFAAMLAVVIMLLCTRPDPNAAQATAPSFREVRAFLWPLLLASGIGLLGLRMDQIIVANRLGPEVYALYAVGAFEIPLFGLLQSSVSSVLMPRFAALARQQEWAEITRLWRRALVRSAVIVFPIAAILIVLAEDFIVFVFGETYRESAIIFRIYLLLAPVRIMTFGLVLRAAGHTKPDLYGAVSYLVAVGVFGITGVSLFGAPGAVAAVVLCSIGLAAFLSSQTRAFTVGAISLKDMYPPHMFAIFFAVVAAYYGGGVVVVEVFGPSRILRLALGAVVSSTTIAVGLLWLRSRSMSEDV